MQVDFSGRNLRAEQASTALAKGDISREQHDALQREIITKAENDVRFVDIHVQIQLSSNAGLQYNLHTDGLLSHRRVSLLFLGLSIESTGQGIRVLCIDKGVAICLSNGVDQPSHVVARYHSVDHRTMFVPIKPSALKQRRAVVGVVPYDLIDFTWVLRDDPQRSMLIAVKERMERLCGAELKDHGIERPFPSEDDPRDSKHANVARQNQVVGIPAALLRQIDADEIRAARAGVCPQAKRYGETVDQTTEYAVQQRVTGQFHSRQQVCQYAGHDHCHHGQYRKTLPNVFEA